MCGEKQGKEMRTLYVFLDTSADEMVTSADTFKAPILFSPALYLLSEGCIKPYFLRGKEEKTASAASVGYVLSEAQSCLPTYLPTYLYLPIYLLPYAI